MEKVSTPVPGEVLNETTRLAYRRTFLAWERTQLAWVRTALSLISFGFAINKFFEYLSTKKDVVQPVFGPATVGIAMIVIGLVCLFFSQLIHRRDIAELKKECPGLPRSLAGVMAWFLAGLGIIALITALIRS